ncbi:MAG: hypothetical protein IPH88_02835 [Bacteroidales bacterium]|nr:hypothetical protein [Bacteroidales bacterium]
MNNAENDNLIVSSDSREESEIRSDLIQIINFQLGRQSSDLSFPDLLLWISNTNGYVSCHWYNYSENLSNEDDSYSVLELPELFEEVIETDGEESFYDKILLILQRIQPENLLDLKHLTLFETSEINIPKLMLKL